jgi:hypothetical protein
LKLGLDHILFAVSVLVIGLLFTPLLNHLPELMYVFVIIGSISFGGGMSQRQKRHVQEQEQIIKAYSTMLEQQEKQFQQLCKLVKEENQSNQLFLKEIVKSVKDVGEIEAELLKDTNLLISQVKESIHQVEGTMIQELKTVSQDIRHGISLLNETIIVGLNKTSDGLNQIQMNDKQLFDSISKWYGENVKQLELHHKENYELTKLLATDLVTVIERQGVEAKEYYDLQILESRRITDSVIDLENKIEKQSSRLLDSLSDGNQLQEEFQTILEDNLNELKQQYEEFNERIANYEKVVRHASEDIEDYRNEIEEDIKERLSILYSLIENLSEATTQLADSKYHERKKALEIQEKLSSQFERLMVRG